ncbi:MAG: MBL fold metallo-hydrolase [Clostridia bacterium]|nr:MBL fold metallo-hydrolase [Clostridia bacterium]
MKITYLGHSCFLIEGKEFSVVTDPFADIGYDVERVKADYCTVSHGHFDHNYTEGVDAGEIITGSNGPFRAIDSFHDESRGAKRGMNRIFTFTLDGIRFCHLGDIGEKYSPALKEKMGKIDVLMIPVGDRYTIGYEEALVYVRELAPAIVIPMHYKTKKCVLDIEGADNFARFAPRTFYAGRRIELTPEDLAGETKTFVME